MRLVPALAIPILIAPIVVVTPTVSADCTSVSGTTICSQGDVRGANTGDGPSGSAGPYVPYPCDLDWYACDDVWDVDFDIDLDPGPGRPDIGRPGGPGGRPGGGGGRPGGGGGRR